MADPVSVFTRPVTDSALPVHLPLLRAGGVCADEIGRSVGGHPIYGLYVGDAKLPLVSIVAAAHADEPAGPIGALSLLHEWHRHPLRQSVRLAVVPILDPDALHAQQAWLKPWSGAVEPERYWQHRLRRLPGADREFAWPGAPWGGTVLPECEAADRFFKRQGPAIAHLSLHGMGLAQGAWYLLNTVALRDPQLWADLRLVAEREGFALHDDLRHGDKGFRRVSCGFSTAPTGAAMRRFFLQAGDRQMAAGFGYGSIEAACARARAAGYPEPVAAVSEFPLLAIKPDAGPWQDVRSGLQRAQLAGEAEMANYLHKLDMQPVPFMQQVRGMRGMIDAVIASALRER